MQVMLELWLPAFTGVQTHSTPSHGFKHFDGCIFPAVDAGEAERDIRLNVHITEYMSALLLNTRTFNTAKAKFAELAYENRKG